MTNQILKKKRKIEVKKVLNKINLIIKYFYYYIIYNYIYNKT